MGMRNRIARLFTIKTPVEAYLVTYAIAVGAIERGLTYMHNYPGNSGVILAIACLGVPFIAGAKLVDSVKVPAVTPVRVIPVRATMPVPRSAGRISRSRPTPFRRGRGSALRSSRRTD